MHVGPVQVVRAVCNVGEGGEGRAGVKLLEGQQVGEPEPEGAAQGEDDGRRLDGGLADAVDGVDRGGEGQLQAAGVGDLIETQGRGGGG